MTDDEFFEDVRQRVDEQLLLLAHCGSLREDDALVADSILDYIKERAEGHFHRISPPIYRTVISKTFPLLR